MNELLNCKKEGRRFINLNCQKSCPKIPVTIKTKVQIMCPSVMPNLPPIFVNKTPVVCSIQDDAQKVN